MAAIYETVEAQKFVGMNCDVCGAYDGSGCNDFVLKYTFGYGSPIDGESVEAAICDSCLEQIIRTHVPSAQWRKPTPPKEAS